MIRLVRSVQIGAHHDRREPCHGGAPRRGAPRRWSQAAEFGRVLLSANPPPGGDLGRGDRPEPPRRGHLPVRLPVQAPVQPGVQMPVRTAPFSHAQGFPFNLARTRGTRARSHGEHLPATPHSNQSRSRRTSNHGDPTQAPRTREGPLRPSHPAVTIHFALDTYHRLVALRAATGLSLNQLVRAALDSLEAQIATILERGRRAGIVEGKRIGEAAGRKVGDQEGGKAGYLKATTIFRLTYPCARCGKQLEWRVGEADADHATQALIDDKWGHGDCDAT